MATKEITKKSESILQDRTYSFVLTFVAFVSFVVKTYPRFSARCAMSRR